jgi:hypothetical protein
MRALKAQLLGLLCLCGCDPQISFDVPVQSDAQVSGGTLLEQLVGGLGFGSLASFDLAQTAEFQNNDVRREQVVSTRLKSLKMTVLQPASVTFDFLDRILFRMGGPGLETKDVARKEEPGTVREMNLDLFDVELAPYVKADSMSLTTDVSGRRPNEDATVRAEAVFVVTARVFGK